MKLSRKETTVVQSQPFYQKDKMDKPKWTLQNRLEELREFSWQRSKCDSNWTCEVEATSKNWKFMIFETAIMKM